MRRAWRALLDLTAREPVMFGALVQAVLVAGAAFGFDLTPDRIAAVMAVETIAVGIVVREHVTPWYGR